ncbi:hypothetical protein BOTCAL_0417g00100 [Botryotinia calthae]|uniref:Uncharacterized protein n=1 Tax=Botryotinia calthae TaxID=38488 RepID=A0A4Y8CPL9_9HELO|nr:hypothetical protein BOTCAL_0417g00100 [Botryotinia calthae]
MDLNVDAQNFNQSIFIRESRECSSGQLWYVCDANDFHGCCSVDACSVSECPDANTAAVGASSASTTSSTSFPKATSYTFTSVFTTSSTSFPKATSYTFTSVFTTITLSQITESSQSNLQTTPQTLSPPTIVLSTTISNPVSSPTHTPSSSPTTVAQTTPPTSSASIIAGAVVGSVALICFAMAAFCCFRFRQKKKQDRNRMFAGRDSPDPETIQFYSTTGMTLQTPSRTSTRSPGFSGLGLGDVFAPFGGRIRTGSTSSAPKSPPGAPAMSGSQVSVPSHSITAVHSSLIPNSQEDDEQERLLSHGPEKSSQAPPESLPPAFHPFPGMPIPRPAYRPSIGITTSELDGREIGRRSVSVGGSERMSESQSDGAVSAMSTPSLAVTPGPSTHPVQGQTQGYWHPNTPPNLPLSLSGQSIQSQCRGNSSNSSSINPDANMNQAAASQYAQAQYSLQQAQHQYTQQVASARHVKGMNASSNEAQNPYQMYRNSREHQQNMEYQHALVRAQEGRARALSETQGQGNGQPQGQRNIQKGKGRDRMNSMNSMSQEEYTGENDDKELRRESSTHSIPTGLGSDARPAPREPEKGTNPHNQNAQMQVHATLYEKQEDFSQPLSNQGSQPKQSDTSRQTCQAHRANPDSLSSTGSPNSTSANVGALNPEPVYKHPGFDVECSFVAPTPPPQMIEISGGMDKKRSHVLSWSEYDTGGELPVLPALDGKGRGKKIVE